MRMAIMATAVAAAALGGCTDSGYDRPGYASNQSYRQYDYNHPDPSYNGYYADRYYRDDPRYRERRLSNNDRVYRGNDGRYYCRRNDGTTGLIVGGLAGGALGSAIAPGGSGLLGAILGGVGGAVAGKAVDKSGSDARCK